MNVVQGIDLQLAVLAAGEEKARVSGFDAPVTVTVQLTRQALATAQESLRVAELSYEVCLVTMADVLAAEAGVAQLEEQLLRLAVQHELAKLTLEKPWVQAAAAPGGASG